MNGIGKSSLIRLIDYLLLSDEAERLFKNKRYQFLREEQHSVQLDIELAGESVSISRCFDPKSAILITRGKQAPNELEKSEARRLLSRLFFPIDKGHALEMERYRSLMTFFIKDDLEAQRRGDPVQYLGHAGANAREMTILNFHLLGLPTRELVDLDRIQTALKAGTDRRSDLVLRIEEMTRKSLAQIRSELSSREKQLKALETALGQYDLMESFQDVSQAIAEHSTKISSLRQEFEQVQRQRLKLSKFVEVNQEIEPREIANQYRQVSSALEQTIRRSLEEVIVFRQSLATERLRFHGKQLQELDLLKLDLLRKLQTHETERAALYRTVDSQGVTQPLREAVEQLSIEKVAIERQRQALLDITEIEGEIDLLEEQVGAVQRQVVSALDQSEEAVQRLREIFLDVVDKALDLRTVDESDAAYLDIARKAAKSRRTVPVEINVSVPRADALGHFRLKLAAYDLTVFLNALESKLPLPQFLIHDGVFHGVSRRTVVRAMNHVYGVLDRIGTGQYFVTFNEDELASSPEDELRDGKFAFSLDAATVARFDDSPEGRLFGRSFS